MKDILTVVTTTYNQEKFIEETIKSVVSQKTNFKFKYLISDDNSTDKTKEIIKKYQKKYPDIIEPIYRKKNLGAMNNFVETLNMVNTEYLALCDGDDYWTNENKLQKQVDFLKENQDYNLVFHQTKIFFENGEKEETIYPILNDNTFDLKYILEENVIPANSVVYRWKFNKGNEFKEKFPKNIVPGDHYVHLLHLKDGKAKLINEVMSFYRRHENGMWWSTSDASKQHLFNLKYGHKLINFYYNLELEFKLPKSFFKSKMKYIGKELVNSCLKEKELEKLSLFVNDYPELYDEIVSEINNKSTYEHFSKYKRVLYLLMFDGKTFKEIIKNRVEKILKK